MITVELQIPAALAAIPGAVQGVLHDIANATHAELVRLAHERLHTTAAEYVAGLQPPKFHLTGGKLPVSAKTVATIVLTGELANMIENGFAGGDMKPKLLAGRNAKTTRKGVRYNTVPMRHGTPGTTGRNMPPMGSAHARGVQMGPGGAHATGTMGHSAAEQLGRKVHKAAMALTPTTTHADTKKTSWGGRLAAGMAPKLRPHHKTDIYAGMVRKQKTYAKRTQNSYGTFRRVSDNSDSRAWIHPGIEAHHLFTEAAPHVAKAANYLFAAALRGIAKGT